MEPQPQRRGYIYATPAQREVLNATFLTGETSPTQATLDVLSAQIGL